jgi:clan AA aspartic protease
MRHVYAKVKIGDPKKGKVVAHEMLVDTGATYTCIPSKMAKELGLPFIAETKVILADGREVKATYSAAYIEMNGRGDVTETRIFEVAEPVIGCSTLEALGLSVDPVSGELKPTRGFIARA